MIINPATGELAGHSYVLAQILFQLSQAAMLRTVTTTDLLLLLLDRPDCKASDILERLHVTVEQVLAQDCELKTSETPYRLINAVELSRVRKPSESSPPRFIAVFEVTSHGHRPDFTLKVAEIIAPLDIDDEVIRGKASQAMNRLDQILISVFNTGLAEKAHLKLPTKVLAEWVKTDQGYELEPNSIDFLN